MDKDIEHYITFEDSVTPIPKTWLSGLHAICCAVLPTTSLMKALRSMDRGTASRILAVGIQTMIVGYAAHRLYKNSSVQWSSYKQLKRSCSRLFSLATQGAEAAGAVAADLGEPDEHGVYSCTSATGTIYLRQSHISYGTPTWEWSIDKVHWVATGQADGLWFSADSCPSSADKVLIQRLEVEAQLISRQGVNSSNSSSHLPPLDLSTAVTGVTQLSQVPEAFICPISMQVMTQPVVTPGGGTFNRPALMEWIRHHTTDPVSGHPLRSDQVYANLAMRDMIHAWANGEGQVLFQQAGSSHSSNSNTAMA